MPTLLNIAISLIASAVIFIGGMNLPASIFSLPKTPLFGAFSEISTATNLADFPTTYNANLNKTIEVGTTSVASITTLAGLTSASALATIGTITSGTWNGSVIDVARQGTGTTSPTSNQVILGNGASGFKVIGFGSSGQFLTSGGAATAPSWTTGSVDQAANYNWTAHHIFTSLFATNASSTNATTTNLYVSGSLTTNNGGIATSTTFTATGAGTWTKPTGARKVFVQMWGGGGSGGQCNSGCDPNSRAGGGGGGGYTERWYEASALSATESVSVGAGGAGVSGNPSTGNAGGNSTFSSSGNLLTAYGGAGGGTGNSTTATGGAGGGSLGTGSPASPFTGAGGAGSSAGGTAQLGAGGGGGQGANGGAAYYGGGGGGGSNDPTAGGSSVHGGAGGAGSGTTNGTAGSVPGGGGGGTNAAATSGAGGNGKIIVTSFI